MNESEKPLWEFEIRILFLGVCLVFCFYVGAHFDGRL